MQREQARAGVRARERNDRHSTKRLRREGTVEDWNGGWAGGRTEGRTSGREVEREGEREGERE